MSLSKTRLVLNWFIESPHAKTGDFHNFCLDIELVLEKNLNEKISALHGSSSNASSSAMASEGDSSNFTLLPRLSLISSKLNQRLFHNSVPVPSRSVSCKDHP